jgi:hypothetical protein
MEIVNWPDLRENAYHYEEHIDGPPKRGQVMSIGDIAVRVRDKAGLSVKEAHKFGTAIGDEMAKMLSIGQDVGAHRHFRLSVEPRLPLFGAIAIPRETAYAIPLTPAQTFTEFTIESKMKHETILMAKMRAKRQGLHVLRHVKEVLTTEHAVKKDAKRARKLRLHDADAADGAAVSSALCGLPSLVDGTAEALPEGEVVPGQDGDDDLPSQADAMGIDDDVPDDNDTVSASCGADDCVCREASLTGLQ